MKPHITTEKDITKFIANKNSSVKEVLKVIDKNKQGVAFIVDSSLKLLGTITDGDVRRFILKGGDVNVNCEKVMNTSYHFVTRENLEDIDQIILDYGIRHIPLLKKGKLLERIFISDVTNDSDVIAVIMAGGEGKRLKEVTGGTPKPLIKIKDKTIIEECLLNLKKYHIKQVYLSLNYKADFIKNYFKNESKLGMDLKYITEQKKLGTAGALSLLPKDLQFDTVLVINADILTSTNIESLIRYHKEHHLLMSIAAKEYTVDIPFGVFDVNNGYLTGLQEKPLQKFLCNAGIYVLDKEVLKYIQKNINFDMTDLIKKLIQKSLPIGVFPLFEYWIDIGNLNDYSRAKKEYDTMFRRTNYE
ncbi:MAG: nucleotidyltransferase family protein [Euryarchaeota archaeon]|nr:nucleotidyltransferase family protein [Euryarchaeota archaeon]